MPGHEQAADSMARAQNSFRSNRELSARATIRSSGDLAMAVERGDVRPDKVFMGRVQAAADRPLILIADDDRGGLN